MKSKKKVILIAIVVLVVLAAIIGGIVYFVKNRNTTPVDVYSMELLNSAGWAGGESSLSGTITSDYVQEVYADEEQDVEDVYVQQGDYVKKGEKLMKYDVEEQELDLQLQELEIKSSQMEIEDLESELSKMRSARAEGTVDSSGSAVMQASLNLSSLKGDILAKMMKNDADSAEGNSEESPEGSSGSQEKAKQQSDGNGEEGGETPVGGSGEEGSETPGGESSEEGSETLGGGSGEEGGETPGSGSSEEGGETPGGGSGEEGGETPGGGSGEEGGETPGGGSGEEGGETPLLDSVDSLEDAESGDGSKENPYVFNLSENAVVKGSVLNQLIGESRPVRLYAEFHFGDDNVKIFTPDVYATGIGEIKEYTLDEIETIQLLPRQLEDSIETVKDSQVVYLLRQNGTIKGSVIINLLSGNKKVEFREYTSESAYAQGNTPVIFTLNPVYSSDGIVENSEYTVDELNEIFKEKILKIRILDISDKTFGYGSAQSPFIYLLNADGTVRGDVVKELADVHNQYYASFREFTDEKSYDENPYAYIKEVEITPGMPVSGIEDRREYTLTELDAALKAAEAASRLPNVLKSEITDKKEDAYSGSGTMEDPYLYRMITGGRIRGSVINDLMKNKEFAVFYEYDSEEDGRRENVANSVTLRPNTIFKESIASFGWYTLTDLTDALVTADKIEIRPERKTVTAGKSYQFTAKLSGKNSEVLSVTWELKRNKSDATTLIDGTLTVGEDETADSLRIIASAGGKRDELTVKVKQKKVPDENSGGGSDYDGGGDYDSGSGGGDIDYSDYTAEELADAIADKEEEIAEAKQTLNEAKIDYEEAKKEVEAATVKATVDGEVTLAYTKEAMPEDGSPAIIVRGKDGMYVDVNVSEMSLDTVKVGGVIYCTSMETYEMYEAEIVEISQYPASSSGSDYSYDSTSNPNSSYYPVVAYIAESDGLVTGESVEVSYSQQSMGTLDEESIYLQKAYVRTDDDGRSYVYKEGKDQRLEKQYVKTGETLYGQYVEILSGITMDDNIAFPYGKNVKEGAKVELSENTDNIIY